VIEALMLFSLGFLAACLLILALAPFVHQRAVRITTKRMLAAMPMSMIEMQADKDRLRAEFAMAARRLEIGVEQMKTKIGSQLGEIGQKAAEINRLKIELGKKTAVILALQTREQVRKSVIERMVKLLMFLFVRSRRRQRRVLLAGRERRGLIGASA
jgi:hypothetical protein